MRKKKNKKKYNKKKYKKKNIPKAIREQCWIQTFGEHFKSECYIHWCKNEINVFDFHVGHDKPESKGGSLDVSNLKPICARCNLSMIIIIPTRKIIYKININVVLFVKFS